ncbi:glycoside hydrolase family 3 C-terminal domain-containing protein [Microbacterium sp. DT81.1]|uniref:glycoside hydrolase family 3 C-terminal domain-containing protein n=1 Tax=Microbacterium sp. DT81.1 TaxID=3393413 RepID=UPI003CF8E8CE
MCAFNQVNGVYICESPLMQDVLKDDYGFDGFIMSDFGSVHSTGASLMNGLDQELNRPKWFTPARLDAALAAGEITQERIDEAAFRVIRSYIRGGLFDNPLPAEPAEEASTPANEAVARQIAEQGSVLLKNEGTLPLTPSEGQTIALFGPTASSTPTDLGGVPTSAVSVCSLTLRFRPDQPPRNTLPCEDVVSAETALTERAAQAGATVTWNNGQDVAAAAAQAAAADVAVVFGYQRMGEFSDLTDLRLQGNGDALISAIEQVNPNTVVVLQTGSAVEMPWLDGVQAVLENWYGGEQQGPAIASLLFGDVAPAGKLPMTFPASLADTPTNTPEQYPGVFADGSTTRPEGSTEIRQVNYTEGLQVGYKWYEGQGIEPLFAFGHGLSYTQFEYSQLKVKATADKAAASGTATVSFTVENTGEVAGTEIPQVYLTFPEAAVEPGKRLIGFDRIELAPGENRTVEIVVDSEDSSHPLSIWDADADEWRIVDGEYTVWAGSSSGDLPLSKTVEIDANGPVATTAPSIQGDVALGKKLTADPGVWSEDGLAFSYQWLRDGEPIQGAEKAAYRVTPADQGTSLSVTVTAKPKSGPSGAATSAAVFVKTSAVIVAVPNRLVGTTTTEFTLSVRVTPLANGVTPEGDVTAVVDGKSFTGTLAGGKATIPIGTFERGIHPITLSYAGSDTVHPAYGVSLITVRR